MSQNGISIQEYLNMGIEQRCMPQTLVQMSSSDLNYIYTNASSTEREKTAVMHELNRRMPSYSTSSNNENTDSKTYTALSIISVVFKIIAWMMFAVGFFALLFFLYRADDEGFEAVLQLVIGVGILVVSSAGGLFWMALSELLKLMIDISQSNQGILDQLRRR